MRLGTDNPLKGVPILALNKPCDVKSIDDKLFISTEGLLRHKRCAEVCFGCPVNFKDPEEVILVISKIPDFDIKPMSCFCRQRYNRQVSLQNLGIDGAQEELLETGRPIGAVEEFQQITLFFPSLQPETGEREHLIP